jgi:hypothetical protein
MYTVAELIEALKQCPQDFPIVVITPDGERHTFGTLGIDPKNGTVDLIID